MSAPRPAIARSVGLGLCGGMLAGAVYLVIKAIALVGMVCAPELGSEECFLEQAISEQPLLMERMQIADEEALAAEPVDSDDDLLHSSPEQRAADRERLANLKSLLTVRVLGTA